MTMLLGGRAAEALVLERVSTGAANDLERVSNHGLPHGDRIRLQQDIGPFSYAGLPDRDRRIADIRRRSPRRARSSRRWSGNAPRCCANRAALERLTASCWSTKP